MLAAPMEKNILCFGDSNTFGSDPRGGARYDRHTRWPGVLRDTLGTGFWVIEEGCGGRTTVHEDPIESLNSGSKSGVAYLPACLHSHQPLDLVIILLGTNDLKPRFAVGADDIARGVGALVDAVRASTTGRDGPGAGDVDDCPAPDRIAGWPRLRVDVCRGPRQVAAVGRVLCRRGRRAGGGLHGCGIRDRQQPGRRHSLGTPTRTPRWGGPWRSG